MFETITLNITEGIATVALNRPEALNTFNWPMLRDFRALWEKLRRDDAVRVVVLRACEGRAFSTGVDVRAAQADPVIDFDNPLATRDPGEMLGPKSNQCWKPMIAAVHGMCCAGAFYWINEADIIIAAEDTQFFDPHVSSGLVAAVEPIGLTYRMPYAEVMRMMLLGNDERVSAATALRIGLISEVLPTHQALWERAQDLAGKIARKPPTAIQGTVRAVWESQDLPRSAALTLSLKYPLLGNLKGYAELQADTSAMKQKPKDGRNYEVR